MKTAVHPRFPAYIVREDGRVFRSVKSRYFEAGREVFGRVLRSGYRQFKLRDANGQSCLVRANRLVCEAFHGPPPSRDYHSCHFDGDRLNNCAGNLRWASAKENADDKQRHGTTARGRRVGSAKLTDEQVAEIRAAFSGKRGEKTRFARRYGCGLSTIGRVLNGEYWRHILLPGRSALDRERGARP